MSKSIYSRIEEHRVKYVVPYIRSTVGLFLAEAESNNGHALWCHVGLSEAQLSARLSYGDVNMASTFYTLEDAENYVSMVLSDELNQSDISEWLLSPVKTKLVLNLPEECEEITGKLMLRSGKTMMVEDASIVLAKDNSERGWKILTAYPSEK